MEISQEFFDLSRGLFAQEPDVKEEGDYIIVKGYPIDDNFVRLRFTSRERVEAMFTKIGRFETKFHKFFRFEYIKLLEEAENKRYNYGVDRYALPIILNKLKQQDNDNLSEVDIDRKRIDKLFEFKPKEHQNEFIKQYFNFKHIQKYRGGLLHGAVGSGKTITSLFLMEGLHTEIDKIFIICPLPTLDKVWLSTLSGEKGTGYYQYQPSWNIRSGKEYNGEKYIVCNYESMDKLHANLNLFKNDRIGIIVDECHNMNDPKSNRTQLLKTICNDSKSENILLMSGTPLKTGYKELANIFYILDRYFDSIAEKRYYRLYQSCGDFLTNILLQRYQGYSKYISKDVLKLEPLNTVNLKIELPPKVMEKYTLTTIKENLNKYIKDRRAEILIDREYWNNTYVTLREKAFIEGNLSSSEYNKYKDDVEVIRKTSIPNLYTIIDKTSFCNKYEKEQLMPYLSKDEKILFRDAKTIYKYYMLKIHGEALSNVIGKARMECHRDLTNYLDFNKILRATTKKTIIFSNYIEICQHVEELLKKMKYKPIGVYGETTKDLPKLVKKFTEDKKMNPLVTTYKSLSTGVPLIVADTIICIDMPYRMYIYEQAVGRAWRLGQDSTVTSFILEVKNDVPNINSRNIDIIKYFEEEVSKITGVKSSVGLTGDTVENENIFGEVSKEEMENSLSVLPPDLTDYIDINISTEDTTINISSEAKNPKRQAVENLILKYVDKLVTGKENTKLYQELFNSMSDKEFDNFMHKLKNREITLSVIIPNNDKRFKVDLNNTIKIAKELGYDFFQHLNYGASEDRPAFKTPNKYMVMTLPIRRAAQLLTKKISIPVDASHMDSLSGQVTNQSKGSKITNPEIQILLGLGLKESLTELLKVRGGDLGAGRAAEQLLFKHGSVSMAESNKYSTDVVSKKTLRAYLNAMGISTTL